MKETSRSIFEFLKANYGADLTANDIASALGVSVPTVTASVNGLVKKGYAVRNAVTTEGADGKSVVTKYISLTEVGLDFNPDTDENAK